MNKTLSILLTLCFMTSATTASAVTKCVRLTPTNCTPDVGGSFVPDWQASCNGTLFSGIGVCAAPAGTAIGTIADTLSVHETDVNKNTTCWCKMTSPAVSKWVIAYNYSNTYNCMVSCGGDCASRVTNSTFINAMFSNLSD